MAVIEIAKIQVRRGQANQTGMPQLDSGEFGWAIDTQQLYIGNGSVAEGAPAVGNTEIVTVQNISNFFKTATAYTYEGNTGYIVNTGPQGSGSTQRTLQNKLDDTVSLADFGVPGDGNSLTPDGAPVYQQIQQAIDEIFTNDTNVPSNRKKLHFPAGMYVITGTIYVPPYASIAGDGPDRTVLTAALPNGATTPAAIMQFGGSTGGTTVWPNMSSANLTTEISLTGIHFSYDASINSYDVSSPLISADCADNSKIIDCKFSGSTSSGSISYVGIEIRGQSAITSRNLLVENNLFSNLHYGIRCDYDIEDTIITKNNFYNMVRGINYAVPLAYANVRGPYRSKITHNNFKNIYTEAIKIGPNLSDYHTDHISAFNSFSEVGNHFLGDNNGVTSIVDFATSGNLSQNDKFERDWYLVSRNNDSYSYIPSVTGKISYQPNLAYTATIYDNISSPTTITRLPYSGSDQTINLQYMLSVSDNTFSRKGNLTVSVSFGSTATVTDSYTYTGTGDGGVTFSANLNTTTNTVKVLYTNSTPNLGYPANKASLEYQYNYLA
jgi:hypothetical protein